jgi:hypothetical protein
VHDAIIDQQKINQAVIQIHSRTKNQKYLCSVPAAMAAMKQGPLYPKSLLSCTQFIAVISSKTHDKSEDMSIRNTNKELLQYELSIKNTKKECN